jgi:hypothetical protein
MPWQASRCTSDLPPKSVRATASRASAAAASQVGDSRHGPRLPLRRNHARSAAEMRSRWSSNSARMSRRGPRKAREMGRTHRQGPAQQRLPGSSHSPLHVSDPRSLEAPQTTHQAYPGGCGRRRRRRPSGQGRSSFFAYSRQGLAPLLDERLAPQRGRRPDPFRRSGERSSSSTSSSG